MNAGKSVRDDTVLVDDVGDATGKTGTSSAIRLAQDMIGVAQQREGQTSPGSKRVVLGYRVKTGPEDLHVMLGKGIVEVTEPAPFGRSSAGVGFGIKPQHHLLATEICQVHSGAIVGCGGKVWCLGANCEHLRPPQEHAKTILEQREQRHICPYDGRPPMLSATSNRARARFTTGTSTTLPSSEVAPLPARSASSKAATTRLA